MRRPLLSLTVFPGRRHASCAVSRKVFRGQKVDVWSCRLPAVSESLSPAQCRPHRTVKRSYRRSWSRHPSYRPDLPGLSPSHCRNATNETFSPIFSLWKLRLQTCAILSTQGHLYQILQACSRTIRSPFLQPKALANTSMLERGPLPRKRASGCGLVLVCRRAASAL